MRQHHPIAATQRKLGSDLAYGHSADKRLDHAAQLNQMVPVASVAREPGRVEAQDGAD